MIWNFSSMKTTCLKEWFQRSTTILDIFSYKCELVKCNCPIFRRAKKRIFVNSKVHILPSVWWKFQNFLHMFSSHHTTRSYDYMYPKMFFFQNLVLVLEMAVLEWFCELIVKELTGLPLQDWGENNCIEEATWWPCVPLGV